MLLLLHNPAAYLMITRFRFFLLCCLAASNSIAAELRPNVLIFLVDDMGVMDSSVPFLSGSDGQPKKHPLNEAYRTPQLERLAKMGTRFEQFYANSVCSPSRVSLMTGQSSARHHVTQWIDPARKNSGGFGPSDWRWEGVSKDMPTLPRMLQAAGYRTIHVGKGHFGPKGLPGSNPEIVGFDVAIAGSEIGQPASYYGKDNYGVGNSKTHPVPDLEAYHGKDLFLTEACTQEMKREISAAVDSRKPFFAYMSYYALHSPFMSDPQYAKNYQKSEKSQQWKNFATLVEGMDASVGALLDHLEKIGVAKDTLIIFLGDNGGDAPLGAEHGYSSSAPLRGKKGTHFEGGMRIPCIIAWGQENKESAAQKKLPILSGAWSREMGTILDVVPTVVNLLDAKPSQVLDGSDLGPVLRGQKREGEQEFLMHFPHEHRSSYYTVYRRGDWKLIYHYKKPAGERCQLFHLAKDPYETQNLADQKPQERERMLDAMRKALKAKGAQYVRSDKKDAQEMLPIEP